MTRRLVLALTLAAVAVAVTGAQSRGTAPPPLVVLLDSAHEARVYDEATLKAGRTNADVLSDLLADLPIRRHAEAISPDWTRDGEIVRMAPALVVVHYSGFNLADATGPRERLRTFITHLAPTNTRVLVYSRARAADLVPNLSTLLADAYAAHPGLKDRVRAFPLLDYGPPYWINSPSAVELKRVVRSTVNLP
jgi:hypothetical protein